MKTTFFITVLLVIVLGTIEAQYYVEAQFRLGLKYEEKQGKEQDSEKTVKLYKKLAERGQAEASFRLGLKYEKGQGVAQNYKKAVA